MNTPLHTRPPPPNSCENLIVSPSKSTPVDDSFNGTQAADVMGDVPSHSNVVDQQFLPDVNQFTMYAYQEALSNSLTPQVYILL